MSNKTSAVKIFKNHEDKSLQKAEVKFSVFSEDVLEIKKTVDKPDEYYTEGDSISFTISIKNNGDKVVNNFKLKDELEEYIKPFGDNYKVVSSKGQITSYQNPIIVEGITLAPKEMMTVKITGVIE